MSPQAWLSQCSGVCALLASSKIGGMCGEEGAGVGGDSGVEMDT